MRMLKGHRKEVQHEQAQQSMPHNIDSYMSATAIPRAEAKLHTPDMVVRPNTSAGTGDRTTLFHMKTTADSSTLSQNNITFFLPTDSTTTFYTGEPTDSREGIIGIALGSPTTSHWASTPQARTLKNEPQVAATSMSAYAHSDRFPSPEPRRQALPKSKLSRWKSLFRKATPPLPQSDKPAFYQLTTTITATRAVRADSHHDDDSMISQVDLASHDTGRTPSPPCFKPNIRASRTFATPRSTPELPRTRDRAFTAGALPANPRASVQRSATTPAPFSFAVSEPRNLPRPSIVTTNSDMTGTSLLDVDIPDIKLDRYSVMFNNLLQPSSDRPSSLLARRQGNVDKLKPLDALAVKVRSIKTHLRHGSMLTKLAPRRTRKAHELQASAQSNISYRTLAISTSFSFPKHKYQSSLAVCTPFESPLSLQNREISSTAELFPRRNDPRQPSPRSLHPIKARCITEPPASCVYEPQSQTTSNNTHLSPQLRVRGRLDHSCCRHHYYWTIATPRRP
jgi:hypothetical protein